MCDKNVFRYEIVINWLIHHHVCNSDWVQTLPIFNNQNREETQINNQCNQYGNAGNLTLETVVFQQTPILITIVRKVSEFFIRFNIEQEQMQSRNRMMRKQQLETKLYRDGLELSLEEKLQLGMYRYLD